MSLCRGDTSVQKLRNISEQEAHMVANVPQRSLLLHLPPNFLCIQHSITHSMPPPKRPHPAPLLCYITPPTLSPLPPPPPSASYPVSATHSHSTPVRYPMPEVWHPRPRIPLPPWRQQISTSLISTSSSSSPTSH